MLFRIRIRLSGKGRTRTLRGPQHPPLLGSMAAVYEEWKGLVPAAG